MPSSGSLFASRGFVGRGGALVVGVRASGSLTNRRHLAAAPRRRAGQPLRRADGKAALAANFNRHDRAARPRLLIGDQLGNAWHRHQRNSPLQPLREPFGGRLLRELRHEFLLDLFLASQPIDAEKQHGVVAQLDQIEHLAECAPLRRSYGGNAEPAVFGLVDADREGRPEPVDADAAHDVAARERLEHDVFGDRDARLIEAELAGAAIAVVHAAEHAGGGGNKAPQPAENAGLEIRRPDAGRSFRRPDQLDEADEGANGRISRFEAVIGTTGAEPAGLDMDQAGVVLLQRGNVEGRAVRRVDVAAVDQDIAARGNPGELRGVTGLQHDARFVEIQKGKKSAGALRRERSAAAQGIAGWRLDLLDGGAEIGKQAGAVG